MAKLPEGVIWFLHDVAMGLRSSRGGRDGISPLARRSGLQKPKFVAGDWVVKFNEDEVYRSTSRESAWKHYFKMVKGI